MTRSTPFGRTAVPFDIEIIIRQLPTSNLTVFICFKGGVQSVSRRVSNGSRIYRKCALLILNTMLLCSGTGQSLENPRSYGDIAMREKVNFMRVSCTWPNCTSVNILRSNGDLIFTKHITLLSQSAWICTLINYTEKETLSRKLITNTITIVKLLSHILLYKWHLRKVDEQ